MTVTTTCPTCSAPACSICGHALVAVVGNGLFCTPCVAAALHDHRAEIDRTYNTAEPNR